MVFSLIKKQKQIFALNSIFGTSNKFPIEGSLYRINDEVNEILSKLKDLFVIFILNCF